MLNIEQLVKDWYYTKKTYYALEKLYLSGQTELLEMVLKDKKEVDKIEEKLFTILNKEYGVKHPYKEIPINLEYVLQIVRGEFYGK